VSVQVFTGDGARAGMPVNGPNTVRSVQFEKASSGTRLRITYRDNAITGFSPDSFTATVEVKLDGVALPLLRTVFDASSIGRVGQQELFRVSSPFTTVGYASDVPAGVHTLESSYVLEGPNKPVMGYVSGPFLIEIDEQP
jgi:hypothetical protein